MLLITAMRKWFITIKKIRILHIGGNLRINGISTFINNLMEGLDKNQFEISVVNTAADDGYYKEKFESFGGKTYNIFTRGTGISRAFGQAKKIKKILIEEGPFDVVHSNYFSNNGLYLKMAYDAQVPTRISHCHQSNQNLKFPKKIAVWISRVLISKYATHRIGCSEGACAFLYGKLPSQVVHYGIDYDKFQKNNIDTPKVYEKHGLRADKKYVIHIGRFAEQKNPMFLLDTYKKIADQNASIDLILVGHGPLKEKIKNQVFLFGLKERVHILNPDVSVEEIYRIAECLMLPSLWEGLPIVLLEAQAMGIRCFVSEHITQEVNLGLCSYLPLDCNIWVNNIQQYVNQNHTEQPVQYERFDRKKMISAIRKIYYNHLAEQYCDVAKELSLGSVNYKSDKAKSLEYYKKAYELENPRGTFGYALAFFEGNSVKRDRNKAQQLVASIIKDVREKAKNGDSKYQVVYGDMFSFGLGQSVDYEEAFSWYKKAAKKNNLEAQCDLGYCYLVGQGVVKNHRLSFKYWLKSAKQGYAHSCRDVGQNYLKGVGVKKNFTKAVFWFKKASDYNYSHGTSDLAYCYLNGLGIEKDFEIAKKLYKKALEQDYDRGIRAILSAKINLNKFLEEGNIEIDNSETLIMNGNEKLHNGTLFINDHIKIIDSQSFYNSDKLEKLLVDNDNPNYSSMDGVLFNKDKKILLKYPIGRKTETYQVPNSVIEIGEYAFQNARYLKFLMFNKKIKKIGKSAFDDCKNLESIKFDQCLQEIGEWSFHGCDKIQQIRVVQGVEKIGKCAFGSCESLEYIYVDQNNAFYTEIDGNLYTKDCKTLLQYAIAKPEKTFNLPNSVETISFRAISDAIHLEKVFLYDVELIQEKAFYYDINLKGVHFNKIPIFQGKQIFDCTHNELKLIINNNCIMEYKNDSLDCRYSRDCEF